VSAAGALAALTIVAVPLGDAGPAAAAATPAAASQRAVMAATHGDLDGDGRSDTVSVIPKPKQPGSQPEVRIDYTRAHPDGSHEQLMIPPVATHRAFVVALAVGDFNGDGYEDLAVGGWHQHVSGSSEVENGTVYVYSGSSRGVGAQPTVLLGPDDGNNRFGAALAAADSNGDGYADLAVGDPIHVHDDSDGSVSVFSGSAAGLATTPTQTIWSGHPYPHGWFGAALTFADVNGDGHVDLVVGEPLGHQGPARHTHGDVQVVAGTAAGLSHAVSTIVWGYQVGAGTSFGSDLASGNVDGHAPVDIVATAPYAILDHTAVGRIVLLTGGKDGLSAARSERISLNRLPGSFAHLAGFGTSIAVGDVTGDGRADVVVGAPDSTNEAGAVVVVPSGPTGLRPKHAQLITQAAAGIPGHVHSRNRFGASLAALVTGHGHRRSIVIGTPGANLGLPWRGAVFRLAGKGAGLSLRHVWVIKGTAEHDRLGTLVAG
jgi:hypothetical protein